MPADDSAPEFPNSSNDLSVFDKPHHRPAIGDRLRVWWSNWRNRKTGQAMDQLGKALRDDPGYRQVWHANLAMEIYDRSRLREIKGWSEHTEISINQANHLADKILKRFFNA